MQRPLRGGAGAAGRLRRGGAGEAEQPRVLSPARRRTGAGRGRGREGREGSPQLLRGAPPGHRAPAGAPHRPRGGFRVGELTDRSRRGGQAPGVPPRPAAGGCAEARGAAEGRRKPGGGFLNKRALTGRAAGCRHRRPGPPKTAARGAPAMAARRPRPAPDAASRPERSGPTFPQPRGGAGPDPGGAAAFPPLPHANEAPPHWPRR